MCLELRFASTFHLLAARPPFNCYHGQIKEIIEAYAERLHLSEDTCLPLTLVETQASQFEFPSQHCRLSLESFTKTGQLP